MADFELVGKSRGSTPEAAYCRLRAGGVELTPAAWGLLGQPDYLQVLWEPTTREIALQSCERGAKGACKVSKPRTNAPRVSCARLRLLLPGLPIRDWQRAELDAFFDSRRLVFGPVVPFPAVDAERVREMIARSL